MPGFLAWWNCQRSFNILAWYIIITKWTITFLLVWEHKVIFEAFLKPYFKTCQIWLWSVNQMLWWHFQEFFVIQWIVLKEDFSCYFLSWISVVGVDLNSLSWSPEASTDTSICLESIKNSSICLEPVIDSSVCLHYKLQISGLSEQQIWASQFKIEKKRLTFHYFSIPCWSDYLRECWWVFFSVLCAS